MSHSYLGVVEAMDERGVWKARPLGLFDDQSALDSFIESYYEKYEGRDLLPFEVPTDPHGFNPRDAAAGKVLFTLVAEAKFAEQGDKYDLAIPVGAFTDKKTAKEFAKDFDRKIGPPYKLMERQVPINPTKAA